MAHGAQECHSWVPLEFLMLKIVRYNKQRNCFKLVSFGIKQSSFQSHSMGHFFQSHSMGRLFSAQPQSLIESVNTNTLLSCVIPRKEEGGKEGREAEKERQQMQGEGHSFTETQLVAWGLCRITASQNSVFRGRVTHLSASSLLPPGFHWSKFAPSCTAI